MARRGAQGRRHRTPVEVTGSEFQSGKYGNQKNAAMIAHRLQEHYRQIENTAFFGGRSYVTSGTHPVGTMGGLAEFLAAVDLGAMSVTGFNENLDKAFAAGTKKKAIFAGAIAARGLQTAFGEQFKANENDRKRYGVRPDWFLNTAYGLVPGFTKADWSQSYSDAEPSASSAKRALFLVDFGHVKYRPLRETKLERNRQGPGEDHVVSEWVSEGSLEVSNPEAMALLSGVTG